MKIIKGKDFRLRNTCVTIGKFDGVHLGHRQILKEMKKIKDKEGLTTVVLTFDFSYFNNSSEERLNSYDEKIRILEGLDVDIMIDYPFDEVTKDLSAEDFIRIVLLKRLGAKAVIVGDNFRFGKGACGDISTLESYGKMYGFSTIVVPCVCYEGENVSSTRIRDELSRGNIEQAEYMLGE